MDPVPKVSIGLPIYNGARKLSRCLDSILAQSFEDFEVIVCDNASTDETPEIIDDYVRRDCRVRQIRWPVNQGAAWNFNSAFAQARGEFFQWVAADDWLSPTFLATCLPVLEADDDVALVYTATQLYDREGNAHNVYRDSFRLDTSDPVRRFGILVHSLDLCNMFYGVYRSSCLRRTPVWMSETNICDVLMLAAIALEGKIIQLKDVLFHRERANRPPEALVDYHGRLEALMGGQTARPSPLLPFCRLARAHANLLAEADIPASAADQLMRMIPEMWQRRWGQQISREIQRAVDMAIHRKYQPRWGAEPRQGLSAAQAQRILLELEDALWLQPRFPRLHLARSRLLAACGRKQEAEWAMQIHRALVASESKAG
jgi:hypothetical protein